MEPTRWRPFIEAQIHHWSLPCRLFMKTLFWVFISQLSCRFVNHISLVQSMEKVKVVKPRVSCITSKLTTLSFEGVPYFVTTSGLLSFVSLDSLFPSSSLPLQRRIMRLLYENRLLCLWKFHCERFMIHNLRFECWLYL